MAVTIAFPDDDEPIDPKQWEAVSRAFAPLQEQTAQITAAFARSIAPSMQALTRHIAEQMAAIVTPTVMPAVQRLVADMAAAMPQIDVATSTNWRFALPESTVARIATTHATLLRSIGDAVQLNATDWTNLQAFVGQADTSMGAVADDETVTIGISREYLLRFGLFLLVLGFSLHLMIPTAAEGDIRRLEEQLISAAGLILPIAVWVQDAP